jgi:hypothetical protein
MALTLGGYRNILSNINYWKLNIIFDYRDVEFKFRNTGLGNNGASKLTISGITPNLFVEVPAETIQRSNINTQQIETVTIPGFSFGVKPKEYVIYTELRGINLERWNVRVPYIVDWDWSPIEDPENVPANYRLSAGLGYNDANELGGDIGRTIPIFDSAVRVGVAGTQFNFSGNVLNIASKTFLKFDIDRLMSKYGEHPYITFYTTQTTANSTNRKFYNVLPVGIEKYKVKLELANGESITRFFDTSWNTFTTATQNNQNNIPRSNSITVAARD